MVIKQISRRNSISAIEEEIRVHKNRGTSYIHILFSSIYSTNRNEYRLANIGPYQIGKIVGDELFNFTPIENHVYSLRREDDYTTLLL